MTALSSGDITRQQVERYVEDWGRSLPSIAEETVTSPAFKVGFLSSMLATILNGDRDLDRLRQEIAGAQQ